MGWEVYPRRVCRSTCCAADLGVRAPRDLHHRERGPRLTTRSMAEAASHDQRRHQLPARPPAGRRGRPSTTGCPLFARLLHLVADGQLRVGPRAITRRFGLFRRGPRHPAIEHPRTAPSGFREVLTRNAVETHAHHPSTQEAPVHSDPASHHGFRAPPRTPGRRGRWSCLPISAAAARPEAGNLPDITRRLRSPPARRLHRRRPGHHGLRHELGLHAHRPELRLQLLDASRTK